MFKWPGVPSPYSEVHEIADFAELLCWREGITSANSLAHDVARLAENDYSEGVPEEECLSEHIRDAYVELERRVKDCGGGYPFCIGKRGDTLRALPCNGSGKFAIYKYLLLATRLNMSNSRRHAGIDGTHLFERLSAEACREYFGDRSESMVFGTATGGLGFKEKVNNLCASIGEGNGYEAKGSKKVREKDGKLDVAAWKHFSDRLPGKFIAFGQCKTGTHYRDDLPNLRPDSFCSKWMQSMPALVPMRMFFLAEALPQEDFYNLPYDAGLLFDRCRIVDYSNLVSKSILAMVENWTVAAANATGLPSR